MSTPTVLDAFEAEAAAFRERVATLAAEDWELATPATPWSIRDQVAHISFVFGLAATAASDAEAFAELTAPVAEVGFQNAVDAGLKMYNGGTADDVLALWDSELTRVVSALRDKDLDEVVPWLVNPLPVSVLTTAGMLELFAHGQDIADALGEVPQRNDSVAYLVHFIHRTRDFGYLAHDLDPVQEPFRFDVTLPSGAQLEVGDPKAADVITGDAVELCLVASRRRHHLDTSLKAVGRHAPKWLPIAQAYRGPSGAGPQAGISAALHDEMLAS